MANSDITKKALAAAFRQLLETTPFEKITVTAIADECGVNRQTFYYHFHDVYDLIGWTMDHDIEAALNRKGQDWRDSLTSLLTSLLDDRDLVLASIRSADPIIMHRLLKDRLVRCFIHMTKETISDVALLPDDIALAAEFFAGGLIEVILEWLAGGCVTTPAEMIDQVDHTLTYVLPRLTPS